MGSHQSHKMLKDEWVTPPHIIQLLGRFDLDPCAPIKPPYETADHTYTIEDDGLKQRWFGRVWLNPPYGRETGKWLDRLAAHGAGIALIFARTETEMFFSEVWRKASALLFIEGRLYFHHVDGTRAKSNAGAPSVLIAYGNNAADSLMNCSISGQYIDLRDRP